MELPFTVCIRWSKVCLQSASQYCSTASLAGGLETCAYLFEVFSQLAQTNAPNDIASALSCNLFYRLKWTKLISENLLMADLDLIPTIFHQHGELALKQQE